MYGHRGMMSAALAFSALLVMGALGGAGCAPLVAGGYEGGASGEYDSGASSSVDVGVSIGVSDYDYLNDYGEWIRVAPYGRVWCPSVVVDWEPMEYGHWVWTYDGWMWASYEPFGWLVYHYGYWDWGPDCGWFWVPGTRWYPSRVQWYVMGDYYAWAPLPPPGVHWPDPWDNWHTNVWVVVGAHDFMNDDIDRYRVQRPVWNEVPRRDFVRRAPTVDRLERVTQRTIAPVPYQRERMNMKPKAMSRPPRPGQPLSPQLQRPKLPDQEQQRVEQNRPRVEREVLVPRPAERPQRERGQEPKVNRPERQRGDQPQRENQQQQQQQQGKEESKKKTRRR